MKLALSLAAAGLALAVGSSYADTSNSKDKGKMERKASSSAGSTVPAATSPALDPVSEQRFKALDIDGDGAISKAEAAGNADLVTGFDRADRNRDGKLSRKEYDSIGKARAKKQQAAR
jgi:hypothetical protein